MTLAQNYQRLGLSTKLGNATGGIEKYGKENQKPTSVDSLALPTARKTGKVQTQEVRVERDPETGNILRVVRPEEEGESENPNPLNDPLNDLMDDEHTNQALEPDTGVVAELEREVAEEAEALARKRPRQQSSREGEWIDRLVQKYGDDTKAMTRDKKLNPMQQTEGDIKRRLRKWEQKKASAS